MAEARAGLTARLGLGAGALLAALLLAEAGVRLLAPQWHDSDTLRRLLPDPGLGRHRRLSDDPDRVYELKPSLDVHFGEARVLTDARGVRVPAEPQPAGADAPKLVVLGDPGVHGAIAPAEPLELVVLGDSTSFGWRV